MEIRVGFSRLCGLLCVLLCFPPGVMEKTIDPPEIFRLAVILGNLSPRLAAAGEDHSSFAAGRRVGHSACVLGIFCRGFVEGVKASSPALQIHAQVQMMGSAFDLSDIWLFVCSIVAISGDQVTTENLPEYRLVESCLFQFQTGC